MKFGAHQTFHLREGWLLKGLNSVKVTPDIFSSPEAVVELGVGKNMVESIEYWLKALQLITKSKTTKGYELTSIAELISESDPYLEQDGSLILCHYLLATNKEEATTWYWFFNKFGATEFESDSLKIYLQSYIHGQQEKAINSNTLDKDILCLLRTYREPSYGDKETPETENPSPFSKFGLIAESNNKLKKSKMSEVHPLVFIYMTYLFWKQELNSAKSVQLEEIVLKESSPGIALGFSMDDCLQMIEQIEKDYPRYIQFSRTGGYLILNIDDKRSKNAMGDYYKAVSTGN